MADAQRIIYQGSPRELHETIRIVQEMRSDLNAMKVLRHEIMMSKRKIARIKQELESIADKNSDEYNKKKGTYDEHCIELDTLEKEAVARVEVMLSYCVAEFPFLFERIQVYLSSLRNAEESPAVVNLDHMSPVEFEEIANGMMGCSVLFQGDVSDIQIALIRSELAGWWHRELVHLRKYGTCRLNLGSVEETEQYIIDLIEDLHDPLVPMDMVDVSKTPFFLDIGKKIFEQVNKYLPTSMLIHY